jgi:hypothetical protein
MAETEFSTRALRDALSRVSETLKTRVHERMDRAASTLVSVLNAKYPVRKNRSLPRGVTKRKASTFGFIVRSASPLSSIIEGTKERYDNTRKNARRGRMKENSIFVPAAVRERKSFLSDAQAMLSRNEELG